MQDIQSNLRMDHKPNSSGQAPGWASLRWRADPATCYSGRPSRVVMRVRAGLLALFALLLFREGLKHLAVI